MVEGARLESVCVSNGTESSNLFLSANQNIELWARYFDCLTNLNPCLIIISNMIKISTRSSQGFTIVELLVVIVVVGILAAITTVSYNGVVVSARNMARIQTASSLITNLRIYEATNGADKLYSLILPEDQCIGSDFDDVDPTEAVSCRYSETDGGLKSTTKINTALYDELNTLTSYKVKYKPVTQSNFLGMKYVISSAPFVHREVFNTVQMDSGPKVNNFTIMSYRLEGENQDCKVPVHRLESFVDGNYMYSSGHRNSRNTGGATECWVWLDFIQS